MRITCPHCGPRGNREFAYLGDAALTRPAPRLGDASESAASAEWMDYVYLRANRPGARAERWYHAVGCRACIVVERSAETHEISRVEVLP